MRRALLCLLLAGCGEAFLPETVVVNLRVLGVQAEPAELRPGESARLTALVKDPSRAAPPTLFWLGCDPDPYGLGRSACSNPTVLQSLQHPPDGGALPDGVRVLGFGPQAFYPAAKDLFSVLPEGDERRLKGTVGQVLLVAIADTVPPDQLGAALQRVQAGEVKAVVTLFRIVVREGEARNTNPVPSRLLWDGAELPWGAHGFVHQGKEVAVKLEATEASFEPYRQSLPDGTTEDKVERLITAWYSTAGRFSQPRLALDSDVEDRFTAPGGEEPNDPLKERDGQLFMVLRDARGGNAFAEGKFWVCDDAAPEPVLRTLRAPASREEAVVLEGEHLDGVLDLVTGGRALQAPYFDADAGRLTARIPAGLDAGSYPLELRSRACTARPDAGVLVIP